MCGWRVANRVGLLADELEKGSRARKAWEEGGNLCFVADIQRVGVFSRQILSYASLVNNGSAS